MDFAGGPSDICPCKVRPIKVRGFEFIEFIYQLAGFWMNLSGSSPSPIRTQGSKSSQGYENLDCSTGPMGQIWVN